MFFKRKKTKVIEEVIDERKYVLNVITKNDCSGYSSHWYGWSSKWLFNYDEAVKKKEEIQHLYHEIEIIEFTN